MTCVSIGTFRERLRYVWNGPADLPRNLRLEWRFVAVRWLGIVTLAPVLLLAHLETRQLIASLGVLTLAGIYNAILQRLIHRQPRWLSNGYISTFGDVLLDIAMVIVGGGFSSAFYLILFTGTLAAAMRFGYGPSLGISLLIVSADGIGFLAARQPVPAGFVMRSLLLPLTTILAGYLREQAQHAEAALQERLRQSNALNTVTGTLGASLDLEAALRAAVTATAQLFGSDLGVLRTSTSLHHFMPAVADTQTLRELEELCAPTHSQASDDAELVRREPLANGAQAVVLELALPSRPMSLAHIAVALPPGKTLTLDRDILDAFVERMTLAVENASLYRALADRSRDLQRAYSDLATAHQDLLSVDEMKTNFLANVSHELRTPLTSIRSFSELLLAYDGDAGVQQEFLNIISTESERLTRLVNDVLDISRIEAGHMNWQMARVEVAELLEDLARTFGPLSTFSDLHFEWSVADGVGSVYGDRDRLNQVIANLLNNAMKFTRGGGRIALRGELVDDEVRVAVADTGVGIALSDYDRIFEKFQQVGDTLTDKPRGTGLGLPICRDIVEYHGGRIEVESVPGQGSTFIVTLPALRGAFVEAA